MTFFTRAGVAGSVLVLLALLSGPVFAAIDAEEPPEVPKAEEPPPPEPPPSEPAPAKTHPWGVLELEFTAWLANPSGNQFVPTAYGNPGGMTEIEVPSTDEVVGAFRFGIALPKEIGTISGSYAPFTSDSAAADYQAGNFTFAELQVVPFGAGALEDGFADGFRSDSKLQLRDWLIAFERPTFSSPRIRGKWHAGIRGLFARREMTSTYYALNPPPELFPPFNPPGSHPDLRPLPDHAHTLSEFKGKGVDVGLDLRFPFDERGIFSVEGGFSAGVLWGEMKTTYSSVTYSYAIIRDGALDRYIDAPFNEFLITDPDPEPGAPPQPLINLIQQIARPLGMQDSTAESGVLALQTYLGFRFNLWRTLALRIGYRDAKYTGSAREVRFGTPSDLPSGNINFATRESSDLSSALQGWYAGLGFSY